MADMVRCPLLRRFWWGFLFCICFLLQVLASTGQEGSGKEALQRRPHLRLFFLGQANDIVEIFLLTLICVCSLMVENGMCFSKEAEGGFCVTQDVALSYLGPVRRQVEPKHKVTMLHLHLFQHI